MHKATTVIAALAALVLTGCATQETRPEPSQRDLEAMTAAYNAKIDDPSQHVVCEKEARVGTRIKAVVCRTQAQIAYEQREGRRYFEKSRPVPWNGGPRVPEI